MAPVPVVQQPEHGKARRTAEVSVEHAGGVRLHLLRFRFAGVFECQERKPDPADDVDFSFVKTLSRPPRF